MGVDARVLAGLHHVTGITGDVQGNLDFYCGVLGLRLVKLTVNFDDPSSYHLYYGDELGRPGTVMTFFGWPGARRGRVGPPGVTVTGFGVPLGAMGYWEGRLKEKGVEATAGEDRFGEKVLQFRDPDGMRLEIIGAVEAVGPRGMAWGGGPVPVEVGIRGFHSVTISEEGYERTTKLLTEVMGFREVGKEGNRFRYRAGVVSGDEGPGVLVDVVCVPGAPHGGMGAGVVHHVAFRVGDDEGQRAWREVISAEGLNVSPVMDRSYFHSIYFREPGGVLFEIATEGPGFTVDEPAERLGKGLMLPAWMEKQRVEIEAAVPALKLE